MAADCASAWILLLLMILYRLDSLYDVMSSQQRKSTEGKAT